MLLGPNGAGKSTALRALAGLLPLSAGRIAAGEAVLADPARELARAAVRPPGRHGVPGLPALPAPQRAGQRRLRAGRPRRTPGRGSAAGSRLAGADGHRRARRDPASGHLRRPGAAGRAGSRAGRRAGGAAARRAAGRPRRADPAAGPRRTAPAPGRFLRERRWWSPTTRWTQPCSATGWWSSSRAGWSSRAAPPEVARRPRTDYVARLVGLNLLAGIGRDAYGRACPAGAWSSWPRPSTGPVYVAFRPAAVSLFSLPARRGRRATSGRAG